MIYFICGEDSYRSKKKLEEIIEGYKKVHKSGLNLIYIDAKEEKFKDFLDNFKIVSMFSEKKLFVLKNVFANVKFQEEFTKEIENLTDSKDIIVVYEDGVADKRTKFFKALKKYGKCQEFNFLQGLLLKKWIMSEFGKNNARIKEEALSILLNSGGNDLWKMANEIKKLSDYKKGGVVESKDLELLFRPTIENDIFKTIDVLGSKNKKQALPLLYKHIENGDNPLYLLSMILYQFRNFLIIKELQNNNVPYGLMIKKSGLHPFVVQKTAHMCSKFSMQELKTIHRKLFQMDLDIKTGKIDAETALDLLVAEI